MTKVLPSLWVGVQSQCMNTRIHYSEAIEQGGRESQQDAVWVAELFHGDAMIAVVVDGMGGHAGGSIASVVLVNEVKKQTSNLRNIPSDPISFFNEIVASAQDRLLAIHVYGFLPRAAFAIILIDVRSGMAYQAHVGDCRIYCFSNGLFVSRTRDHSYVQWLFEQGEISEEDMAIHSQQHQLTQALGAESAPTLSTAITKLDGDVSFLLCSDGLWEQFSNDEMVQRIKQHHSLELAGFMAKEASNKGGEDGDNISLAYLRVRVSHSKILHAGGGAAFATINWKSILLWLIPTALFAGFAWSVLAPKEENDQSQHKQVMIQQPLRSSNSPHALQPKQQRQKTTVIKVGETSLNQLKTAVEKNVELPEKKAK